MGLLFIYILEPFKHGEPFTKESVAVEFTNLTFSVHFCKHVYWYLI